MANLVQRGFAKLNRALESVATERVRYFRGAVEISDSLPAILSAPRLEQVDEGGKLVIGREFTWRLKRSDLIWEGKPDRPRRLDLILWIHDDATYTFEVLPNASGAEAADVDQRQDWLPARVKLKSYE